MLPGGRGVLFTIVGPARSKTAARRPRPEERPAEDAAPWRLAADYLDTGHLVYATVGSQGPASRYPARSGWSGSISIVSHCGGNPSASAKPCRLTCRLRPTMPCREPVCSPTCRLARRRGRLCGSTGQGRRRQLTRCRPPVRNHGIVPRRNTSGILDLDRESDIWTWDFSRESPARLTLGSSIELLPRWTPDGRRIVFQSNRDGPLNMYSVASDGSGPVERLMPSTSDQWPNSITLDGTAPVCRAAAEDRIRYPPASRCRSPGRRQSAGPRAPVRGDVACVRSFA